MFTSKLLDAVAMLPGCAGEQSDAEQAYTQAKFGHGEKDPVETWVRLPRERWPKEWHGKFKDPVVPPRLALYGHPLSGVFWERHCREALLSVGFTTVPGWECLYLHKDLKLVLAVYVDDFKLSGLANNIPKGWDLIRTKIRLDPPTKCGEYLGCGQESFMQRREDVRRVLDGIFPPALGPDPGLGQGVQRATACGVPAAGGEMPSSAYGTNAANGTRYLMKGSLEQCIDKYCELADVKRDTLRPVKTPSLDEHNFTDEDLKEKGLLAPVAASVFMKNPVHCQVREVRPAVPRVCVC